MLIAMKKTVKYSFFIAGICIVVLGIFALSFNFSSNISTSSDSNNSNDIIPAESLEINSNLSMPELEDFVLTLNDFSTMPAAVGANVNSPSNTSGTVSCTNKYGDFTVATKNGTIHKYKYGDNDTSDKFLVKGTAKFAKKDITFDGYFIVDNNKTGNTHGQMIMYKGEFTFPNGDQYDGTLSHGKYYKKGTYTWEDGRSYTGYFTTNNTIGFKSAPENKTSYYGKYYFDSSKKKYLYIRFVDGKPYESGYYYYNGQKYKVKFNSSGKCIYTETV